jgi:hypothetical protein
VARACEYPGFVRRKASRPAWRFTHHRRPGFSGCPDKGKDGISREVRHPLRLLPDKRR